MMAFMLRSMHNDTPAYSNLTLLPEMTQDFLDRGWDFVLSADNDWQFAPSISREDSAHIFDAVIAEIGPLAPNQSYQFSMADGIYATITGWRPLTCREELHRYFPGNYFHGTYIPTPDVPETIGDFTLREIIVGDRQADNMLIFNQPKPPLDLFFFNSTAVAEHPAAPVGEIFTRPAIIHDVFALYENSDGVQVGMGVTWPIFGRTISPETHTYIDGYDWVIYCYGNGFWLGLEDDYPGLFRRVLYQDYNASWPMIELWYVNDSAQLGPHMHFNAHHHHWGNPGTLTPVAPEELEALVRIFNPAALVREYDWQFISLQ